VGTLETSEAPVEDIPLLVSLMEMPNPEVLPTIEAVMIENVATAEHVSLETPQGEVANSGVNIITSTSTGNNCSVLNLSHIFYICS